MHNKQLLLLTSLVIVSMTSWSQNNFSTITDKGAWCWFADPRAIHYKNDNGTINNTYIGYIDAHGNIKATQINHLNNSTNEVLIRSWFQPDDHNNPTFLVLPDERIMIFYSRHTDEPCFYYRISRKKGDITTLGKEIKLATHNNTTYPSPFILSDDPNHIYLCWRGINWHPTIAKLTIPDSNDSVTIAAGPYQIVQSTGARPYAKYYSNGKDKIYLTYTTGHPDNEYPNWVYFNYIDVNTLQLKDVNNTVLSIVSKGVFNVNKTPTYASSYPATIVDAPSDQRDWVWQTNLDKDGKPVIALASISNDKKSHNYYFVKWTGHQWQKTFLTNAGGHFHQTPNIENCYSGGMAIDKTNPQIIYGSVPVNGKYGLVYELKKFTVKADGTLSSVEQLTFDSQKNNVRPYMVSEKNGGNTLIWMYGDYFDWIVNSSRPKGYATALRTNLKIPSDNIDLKKELQLQKFFGSVSPENKYKMRIPRCRSFSIVLSISLDSAAYYGEVVKFAGLTYGVSQAEKMRPYLKIGRKTYFSSNVLGTSDEWQKRNRGTGGQWYAPDKLKNIQLAISYDKGELHIFINGLSDQFIEITGLQLSDVVVGGFKGFVNELKVYSRALAQDEIKTLAKN